MKSKSKRHKKKPAQNHVQETVEVQTLPQPNRVLASTISRLGYGLSGAVLIAVLLFMLQGYRSRPAYINENLLVDIFNDVDHDETIIAYPGQSYSRLKDKNGGTDQIYLQVGPDRPAGFIVPFEWLHIPKHSEEIAVSFQAAYIGAPVIEWGFSKQSDDLEALRNQERFVKNIFVENHRPTPALFTALPIFYRKSKFTVPWDEADYFYFHYHSKEPTEIILVQIKVMER